jgi:malate dehydrogenase (oxaloacetate-decarboxylating)
MTLRTRTPAAGTDEAALEQHRAYRGKVQIMPKCPLRSFDDFAIWYTPGVAAASRAIAAERALVFDLTNKGNTVAVVSDGSRVLGLGDIGPEAAMPVMEGKALLFKYLGGVDAVPICLGTRDPEAIISTVRALAPSFGGINLEDIASPKCFRVLDALRLDLPIPVWHDDQQGTATVVLAGLLNALDVVGKPMARVRIALIGIGAANMAVYRLLKAEGVNPQAVIACDSGGTLHGGRADIEACADAVEKWRVCRETNGDSIVGGIAEALRGADVCLAFSRTGPDVILPAEIGGMAKDAIVFACANPVSEILPDLARAAGAAVVATGRSDFPNQVNNSLVFPGVFRGVLDVRARAITDGMARAAAHALAGYARSLGISRNAILPRTDDMTAAATIAAAIGIEAQAEGVAQQTLSRDELFEGARRRIHAARRAHDVLDSQGCFADLAGKTTQP